MGKGRLKCCFIVLMIGFLLGIGFLLPVVADTDDKIEGAGPNLVRGFITEVKRDSIRVNGERYELPRKVPFHDGDGGEVKGGKRKLKRDMRVDLVLKDNVVIGVIIHGLLME